jgi:hypothetical protein
VLRPGPLLRLSHSLNIGKEVVGEHVARGHLLGRDHGAQHFGLATIVLCLRGIVDGSEFGLAVEAIRKELGRRRFTNSEKGFHGSEGTSRGVRFEYDFRRRDCIRRGDA